MYRNGAGRHNPYAMCIFERSLCTSPATCANREEAFAQVFRARAHDYWPTYPNKTRVEKKTKYSKAAEDRRASFTPFLSTCEAIFDHEAIVYLKKLSNLLSSKWDTSYSQVHGWLKARLQICILRSVSLCIRGSRTKWRGAGIEHGAQIPLFKNLELF